MHNRMIIISLSYIGYFLCMSGPPDLFPDLSESSRFVWAMGYSDLHDDYIKSWIEVQFDISLFADEVTLYYLAGAGTLNNIYGRNSSYKNSKWKLLFTRSSAPDKFYCPNLGNGYICASKSSYTLFPLNVKIDQLRMEFESTPGQNSNSWLMIDAIKLVGSSTPHRDVVFNSEANGTIWIKSAPDYFGNTSFRYQALDVFLTSGVTLTDSWKTTSIAVKVRGVSDMPRISRGSKILSNIEIFPYSTSEELFLFDDNTFYDVDKDDMYVTIKSAPLARVGNLKLLYNGNIISETPNFLNIPFKIAPCAANLLNKNSTACGFLQVSVVPSKCFSLSSLETSFTVEVHVLGHYKPSLLVPVNVRLSCESLHAFYILVPESSLGLEVS
jgi:hypothetical protein